MAASSSSSAEPASAPPNPAAVSIAYAGRSLPLSAPPPSAVSRRPPPPCWTHEETLALIDSYRDKWYALRRGNLRSEHWEEVAEMVAARCRNLPTATPKTHVQCRHKVEKLRRRLRTEKQRSLNQDPSGIPFSSWAYFAKMDSMERGTPTPSSSRPSPRPSPLPTPPAYEEEEDDEEDDYPHNNMYAMAQAHAHMNARPPQRQMVNGGGGIRTGIPKPTHRPKMLRGPSPGPRMDERGSGFRPSPHQTPVANMGNPTWGYGRVKPEVEELRKMDRKRRREERREEEEDGAGNALGDLASALRMLGDSFLRMEQMKMDMAREREKMRMEMELKRTEVILDCHRSMAESLANGFNRRKKRATGSPES